MEASRNQTQAPMRLHGAKLADYAIEQINKGLEEAEYIAVEHSVGHMVMRGLISAEDGYDYLDAYERALKS